LEPEPRPGLLKRLKLLVSGPANTPEDLEREIHGLVDHGEAKGLITPGEGKMIEAILELDETSAEQVMVPRTDMATVAHDANMEETIAVIVESGHSRIPITGEDLDHIKGVLHAKDLLSYWGGDSPGFDLLAICRPPFFVPQSVPIDQLLSEFKRKRVHLAVVVDEYGGTAGIITMEDVLEEIVGEIVDEYDQEEVLIVEQSDGSLAVDAHLEIEKLSEYIGVELPEELPEGRFETVGGFITTKLGRVPRPQEEVSFGKVRMVVVGADQRRVTLVQVYPERPRTEEAGD
jgi:hemolysin (HlyC) family protein